MEGGAESIPEVNLFDALGKYFSSEVIAFITPAIEHGEGPSAANVIAAHYENVLTDEEKEFIDDTLLPLLVSIEKDKDADIRHRTFASALWQALMMR